MEEERRKEGVRVKGTKEEIKEGRMERRRKGKKYVTDKEREGKRWKGGNHRIWEWK